MESKELTFLIVDDQMQIRRSYKNNLLSIGVKRIIEAADGKEALAKIKNTHIDYIISAWDMPRMGGLDLLKAVRSSKKHKNIPFMLASAETNRRRVELAIRSGIDVFLIKPFTTSQLIQKINKLIQIEKHIPLSNDEHKYLASALRNNNKKSILVVDDTPTNIDVIKGILCEKYKILVAINGQSALKIANSKQIPDLILLDIMMPEMDGMEVCRELKANPLTEHIPIIFLTAKSETDDIVAGLEIGAVDYITKPINPKILQARVRTQLNLKNSMDTLNHQIETLIDKSKLQDDINRIKKIDFKSPLSSIIKYAENINSSNDVQPEHKNKLQSMINCSYDMMGLITKSIDLSKLESGSYKLKKEPVDIDSLFSSIINNAKSYSRHKSVDIIFKPSDDHFVNGERALLHTMLNDLLKSAIVSSPKNSAIQINIENNRLLTISIRSMGTITEEIRHILSDETPNPSSKKSSNFGFYLANLIANTHSGSICVNNSDKNSVLLTISLPLPENNSLSSSQVA